MDPIGLEKERLLNMSISTTRIMESRAGEPSADKELIARALAEWIVPALARHVLATHQRAGVGEEGCCAHCEERMEKLRPPIL
jgi:hypothetical protein